MKPLRGVLRVVLQLGLVAGLLLSAVLLFRGLLSTRVEAVPASPQTRVLEVQAELAQAMQHRPLIRARGEVIPSRELTLRARVGGEVLWLHPALQWGGRVEAGDLLVRIEPKDYRLAVEAEKIAIKQAEAQLELEKGRQSLAKRELDLLKRSASGDIEALLEQTPSLAARVPQLETSQGQVESAKNRLARAKLELERSEIRAPYSALVRSENVEVGEVVVAQSPLATLVASDEYWISLALPLDRLSSLEFGQDESGTGASAARVILDDGRQRHVWDARLLRLVGEVEASGRMARALVSVPNPLDQAVPFPLLLGASVEVELEGRMMTGVRVPASALRAEDSLLVVDESERVSERTVRVVWRDREHALISEGLADGERVVVTRIAGFVDGMQVALRGADAGKPDEPLRADSSLPKKVVAGQASVRLSPGASVSEETESTARSIR